MAREKRVQSAGFHYITNRSVELRSVFIIRDDYHFFIEFLCKLSSQYNFNIHSYVLLPHSFHLLLETATENLSLIMKTLSSKYAHNFNLKYGRNGALWEGRYKSSFIEKHEYVFYFIAYMENLSKLTGITLQIQNYNYSTYRQFVGLDERLECIENSIIFKKFNTIEEIKLFFKKEYSKEFINNIIEVLRRKKLTKISEKKVIKKPMLSSYFYIGQTRKERNKSIVKAYDDGFSQLEISKVIGVSQQAVCQRINRYKLKNN